MSIFYFYIATPLKWKIIGVPSIYCKGYVHKRVPCIMQAGLHFAAKHGLEVTELMEVVKSTQRLNVECFPCSQTARTCLILALHSFWTWGSFSASFRSAWHGDASSGLHWTGRFCTKLRCRHVGCYQWPHLSLDPSLFHFRSTRVMDERSAKNSLLSQTAE